MKQIIKHSTAALLITCFLIPSTSVVHAETAEAGDVYRIWEQGYGFSVTVDKLHALIAGKTDDTHRTTIDIEELVPGTFLPGREITFSLPKGVKSTENINVSHNSDLQIETTTSKITIRIPGERQEQKYQLKATMHLTARIDKIGEIKATLKGRGLKTREILVARVIQPARIESKEKPESFPLKLGKQHQSVPDLLLMETKAGSFRKEGKGDITFYLTDPNMEFSEKPTVHIIEGDLEIDPNSIQVIHNEEQNNKSGLTFTIKKESSKPSIVQISDNKITTNRVLADGTYNLIVQGGALAHKTLLYQDKVSEFPYVSVNAFGIQAKKQTEISLQPGSERYYEGKTEKKLTAASYIKYGRTYIPLTLLTDSLGVHKNNVLWDAKSETLTLFHGLKVMQWKKGSSHIQINQADIPLPEVPEIKNGQVMFPLAMATNLLGIQTKWDASTGKVVITPL